MRRTTLIYLFYFAAAVSLAAATAALGNSGNAAQMQEPEYVENREPVSHTWLDPAWAEFADSAANHISDPSGSLIPFMEKLLALRSGRDSVVSILHIGDSHVQAGYWTARMRELFQGDFGDAGRGLIVPYKLAGGNEPRNYAVRTSYAFTADKATANNTDGPLGFTGISVHFDSPWIEFEIWSKKSFNSITLFHHEKAPMMEIPDSLQIGSYCDIDNTPTSTRLVLSEAVDSVMLSGFVTEEYDDPTFYGFSLENGNPGVLFHAIGSNGAAFQHFSANTTILDGGAEPLHPDLIIVSLGTNNCYGRNYRAGEIREIIGAFVGRIRASYPNSAILLTTPRESCRRSGRRYLPNPNIADIANAICETAAGSGAAFWNMYNAAGGKNTSENWVKGGLAGRDRIHLTENGYALLGDLFYEAFVRYYNDWLSPATDVNTDGHPGADSTNMSADNTGTVE